MVRPPYQRAWALSQLAIVCWESFHGEAAYRGVDLKRLSLVDLLSAFTYWLYRDTTPDQRADIDSRLQAVIAPDLYAWRVLLPMKPKATVGEGMSREEFLAQYQGLPGVNVG